MKSQVDRTTAITWSNRGKDERDRGFPERALACFNKALEFDPDYPNALINKAQALLDLWRVEEAGLCASRALSIDPNSQGAHNNRGLSRLYRGALQEALSDFEAVIKIDSKNVDALYNAGLALVCQGRIGEAADKFESALSHDAKCAAALYWLGVVGLVSGDPSRAVEMLGRFLQLQPSHEAATRFRELAVEALSTGASVTEIKVQLGPLRVTLGSPHRK